jgi:uncharacterized protein DUF5658
VPSSRPSRQDARSAAADSTDRRGPDRRSRTFHSLFYGSFNPRRRNPRRGDDTSLAAVDWHHPQWLGVALLIVLLSCADAFLTLTLIERGAYEANPFMAPLVGGSPLAFTVVKIGLTGGGVVLLTILVRLRIFRRVPIGLVLYAVLAAYAALVMYEMSLLERTFVTT